MFPGFNEKFQAYLKKFYSLSGVEIKIKKVSKDFKNQKGFP